MSLEQLVDIGLIAAYILIVLAAVSAVVMGLINSFGNPKTLIKSAGGVVLLVVIFFIGYLAAPAEFGASTAKAMEAASIDPTADSARTTFKIIGGAMTTTLILIIVAVVGLIYSSIARIVS